MSQKNIIAKIENNTIGNVYRVLYRKSPSRYRRFCSDSFRYADIKVPEEIYYGFLLLYGIILGVCSYFIVSVTNMTTLPFNILISIGFFIVFEIALHYIIVMIGDKRAMVTEEILPDALKLMASNIRSGLTPDKALMLSARPEFGPLEIQIRKAARKSFSGASIKESLETIPENIDSEVLRRTIKLISDGISKGGDFSNLLDAIAEDISRTRILKKEVQAQVMMYSIFIFFASAIAAPVLYSISSQLVIIMSGFSDKLDLTGVPKTGVINLNIGTFKISTEFLSRYSIISLVVTSIFGGLLLGILKGGSEKDGLKNIPAVLIVSLSVYFISRIIIAKLFASIVV